MRPALFMRGLRFIPKGTRPISTSSTRSVVRSPLGFCYGLRTTDHGLFLECLEIFNYGHALLFTQVVAERMAAIAQARQGRIVCLPPFPSGQRCVRLALDNGNLQAKLDGVVVFFLAAIRARVDLRP